MRARLVSCLQKLYGPTPGVDMKNIFCALLLLLAICITSACVKQGGNKENGYVGETAPYDAPRPAFSTPVTLEELRAAYYRYSVVSIVRALLENNEENFDFIFDKVASGDEKWIMAFVQYVAPGTDASTATGVTVALAHALPNNPKAVLYLDDNTTGPSLHRICTLPFIEPEYAFIEDYGKRALAALRQVDDPYLLDSRDVCIRRLQESLDYCEKLYKEGKWN